MNWIKEVHSHALFRAIGDACNLRNAQRRGVRGENRSRAADLIEQCEYLNFRFHLLGHCFNHQIGFARCFLYAAGVFQSFESGLRFVGGDFLQFDGLIQICANLVPGLPERRRQQVLEYGAIAKRSHLRDATPHNPGADDGDVLDLRHD